MSAPTPFEPARLGPVTLRNRIIKAATFEGRTPKRLVTDDLVEFHRRVAAGGVGMTTVAYCAVTRAGSTDGHQLTLDNPEIGPGLRKLTDAIHAEGAAASAQIGHAGPVANPAGTEASERRAVARVQPARDAPHAGRHRGRHRSDHRPLPRRRARPGRRRASTPSRSTSATTTSSSAFLSPKLNRRTDEWGGSLENRADSRGRSCARCAKRSATAPRSPRSSTWPTVSRAACGSTRASRSRGLLEADGALDAMTLTGGSSFENPMYLFRGDAPIQEMAATFPRALRPGFKLLAGRFFKEYPFEEAYFLQYARQFRDALSMPLILLGGIDRLETIERALADGFAFVQMARALLREPDLVQRMQADAKYESLCIHCNKCMPTIYRGTRCVLVDNER